MEFCDLNGTPPLDYKGYYVWCADHNLPADHCGTDGDSPVCEVFARVEGCNDHALDGNPREMELADILLGEVAKNDNSETGKKVMKELKKKAREELDRAAKLAEAYFATM